MLLKGEHKQSKLEFISIKEIVSLSLKGRRDCLLPFLPL